MLWARGDSTPDISGEEVVLDIRARSKAVQGERKKDPRSTFRREQWRTGLLGPPTLGPEGPSVPTQQGLPHLQTRMKAVGKQLWGIVFLTHLLQLQNVSQAVNQ